MTNPLSSAISASPRDLLQKHFDIAIEASDGIKKLRELILTLAMQGKLVPQDPNDQPASELLKEVEAEKRRLVGEGKIKERGSRGDAGIVAIKPEEIPYEVPKGWEWVRLSDISVKIHYGYTASADQGLNEIKLLRITDIQENKVDWNSVPGCDTQKRNVLQYLLENNDILIARTGGTVGKSYLVQDINVDAVFASYLIRVVPSKKIFVQYLKYFLECPSYWKQLYAACSGTGQPNVNGTSLSDLIFALPPLAEQKRIVAKIDQLIALCDILEQQRNERQQKRLNIHAAAIQQILDPSFASSRLRVQDFLFSHFSELYSVKENVAELRKAILQLAVMGKLVPQDPKDQPASELRKEIEAEKQRLVEEGKIKAPKPLPAIKPEEIPYEVPEGWEWAYLTQVVSNEKYSIKRGPFGSSIKKAYFVHKGHKIYEQQNAIYNDFKLGNYYIDIQKYKELYAFEIRPKDLIISCSGTVGRIAIAPDWMEPGIINQALLKITLNEKILLNIYFIKLFPAYFMNTKTLTDLKGTAQKNIVSVDILKTLPFPLPPLAEQKRICAKIDQLMAFCDSLEQGIDAATRKQSAVLGAVLAQG